MKKTFTLLLLMMSLNVPSASNAASIALATSPLATATLTTVQPNIMFVLDNSGSMGWNYLPDIIGSYTSDITLFNNPKFNGVMYDTGISYTQPAYFNADGTPNTTTYPSQTGTTLATGANTANPLPNWNKVKVDGYGVQSTSTYNAQLTATLDRIFKFVPGEICTAIDLKTCIAGTTPTTSYPYAASLRWCSTKANATAATPAAGSCRATYIAGSFPYARYPSARTTTITVSGTSTTIISSITVNGVQILSAPTSATNNTTTQATYIAGQINACNGVVQGACGAAGYGATSSSNVVTIYANTQSTLSAPVVTNASGSMSYTTNAFTYKSNATTGTANSSVPGYNLVRIIPDSGTTALYPDINSTTKASARTDCAGSKCTANEELINYANWYAYYHTRMQMMKTGVSNAFKNIGSNYRVGFNTINDTSGNLNTSLSLPVDTFATSQKRTWYDTFFAVNPTGSTTLRAALTFTGRYFAHKNGFTDPMQYSCQQNFAIISTDGYWNESNSLVVKADGSAMTDQDGGTTVRPQYEGTTASANSLADAAKYYYDTDLRNSGLSNCTGILGLDVCTDNVFTSSTDTNTKQHMTSFTLGLGADGQLVYQDDYPTATTGDYHNIVNGALNWPVPVSNAETTIDDLWHAAVNAHGQYFSAKTPTQLSNGLNNALSQISARVGAGAAAATSTLNPVAGDNYAYVASYTTAKWYGNIEQRTVNILTGQVSTDAVWCAENIAASSCSSPGVQVTSINGGSTDVNCVTSGVAAASSCAVGVYDAVAQTCSVPMATSCIGTLPGRVAASSDTRTIKMSDGAGALVDFTLANLTAAGLAGSMTPSALSQYGSLTVAQQGNATAANLVNYLRGQKGYEIAASNPTDNQVFRYREAVMGDAIESQPAYIAKPVYSYADAGYSAFKTAQASRTGTVYLGTNDGMLHAFDTTNGAELWAFVPTPVIPNMLTLADKNYTNLHKNYVNGDITIADICTANCTSSSATWKTILVGGLHGGGRGYYALDITTPSSPTLLWEFTTSNYANLGYSFGAPLVTKKLDGTWVVLLATGYNNSEGGVGDGVGRLLVVDAASGALLSNISTATGSTGTPSGLAQINYYVDNLATDNTASYVYGGDLQGNVWRFDINANSVMKFATLLDASSNPQPITVRPELANINGNRMVYIGTGKYLEVSDLTNTQLQTVYGIIDANASSTLTNARASLVQQTLTTVSGTSTRTVSSNAVNYASTRGWYINLPDTGERQNVASTLASGTLIVPSNVPANTACTPGGYGWLNYVDYQTGGAVDHATMLGSTQTNAMIVGLNVMYLGSSYSPVVNVVTADRPTPQLMPVPFRGSAAGFQSKRVIWRELIQ